MTCLIHVPVDPRAFAEWAASRAPGRGGIDDGQAFHALLSACFGKGALQPFRVFSPDRGAWSLYAYTGEEPETLEATANAVAPPEMADVLDLGRLRAKAMPSLAAGTRLGFDVRVRPVRRGRKEMDAFLCEALAGHPEDEAGMAKAGRTREAVYCGWLAERLFAAAAIETARLSRFERRRVWRDGRSVEGPDATVHGTLVVEDQSAFADLLAHGVGRHRAYGYGMLMLRPPDRAAPAR